MGIIFQNGFGLGAAPSGVVGDIWDLQYTSTALAIYPDVLTVLNDNFYNGVTVYNSSIVDAYAPGTFAALAKTSITTGQKYMITFGLDFDVESTEPNYWLGFGSRSTNLYDYLGSNDNSVGIANTGDVNFSGTTISTGLPTFGTVGDIIDVAIDGNNKMWYRVNGGLWNGSPIHNPGIGLNGIDISSLFGGATLYPAIALFGGSGPSAFSVYETSPYGLPSGFTQIAGDRPSPTTFTITSDMFDTTAYAGPVCNDPQGQFNGLTGFTVSQAADLGCGIFTYLSGYTFIEQAFIAASAPTDWHGVICSVTWGPGSTVSNGFAKVSYDPGNHVIRISTIDPTDTDYLTNDNNAGNSTSLVGTFNFPATFTILTPIIEKGGWC
jgi:hypothetical protein